MRDDGDLMTVLRRAGTDKKVIVLARMKKGSKSIFDAKKSSNFGLQMMWK